MGSTVARGHGAVLGVLCLVLAGCYYAKYDKLARTHVALLEAMAAKISDVTARDGRPPADMAEYRYPLERARDFERIAARRFEGRPSLVAFDLLCSAYADLLDAADRVRGAPADAAATRAFVAARDDVPRRARVVLGALDGE